MLCEDGKAEFFGRFHSHRARVWVCKKIASRVLFGLKYYVTMNAVKCLRLLLTIERVLRQYRFTRNSPSIMRLFRLLLTTYF